MNEIKELQVTGNTVILRELQIEDGPQIIEWRNDLVLGKYLGRDKATLEEHNHFFERYCQKDNDYYFVAETKGAGQRIGTAAIYDVDYTAKNAEFGRLLVCEEHRLKAFEIAFLSLRFAFEELKLHKVYCQVQDGNQKALKFDRAIGFKQEGLFKQHYFDGHDLVDVYFLGMFKEDYLQTKERFKRLMSRKV